MQNDEKKPAMTVSEAGRLGGKALLRKHGKEHFKEIGKKGGQKMSALVAAGKAALEGKEGV